jgi:predicted exporter
MRSIKKLIYSIKEEVHMFEQLDMFITMLYLKATGRMQEVLKSEDGDTNFISIMIILGIILLVVVVFISFKDQIMNVVGQRFSDFMKKF